MVLDVLENLGQLECSSLVLIRMLGGLGILGCGVIIQVALLM